MNLFTWGNLDREILGFVLRRKFADFLEPAILKGWMVGNLHPDMLFKVAGMEVAGGVYHTLSVSDFAKLDAFFAIEDNIHQRTLETVWVPRAGITVTTTAHVYWAGTKFHKIKGGRIL